jgi:IclR family KDG regulon transcriptional repressor
VRSVARAVSILEQFTLARPELTLTEISEGSGLSRSTAHRLLAALRAADMVEFDDRTTRYHLGLKNFRFGNVVYKSMRLARQATPLLRALSKETGETVFLLAPDGDEAICLLRCDDPQQVRVLLLDVGRRSPFNWGAGERVLLAHLPRERWEEITAGGSSQATAYSLATRDELARDRRAIQERGYCVGKEDASLHVCSVGAPVRDANGTVIAAVSLAGMTQRFSAARLPSLTARVVQVADELSRRMGYVPSDVDGRPLVAFREPVAMRAQGGVR